MWSLNIFSLKESIDFTIFSTMLVIPYSTATFTRELEPSSSALCWHVRQGDNYDRVSYRRPFLSSFNNLKCRMITTRRTGCLLSSWSRRTASRVIICAEKILQYAYVQLPFWWKRLQRKKPCKWETSFKGRSFFYPINAWTFTPQQGVVKNW